MKDKKFLFLYCSTPGLNEEIISQPLGILYLGAILLEEGVAVTCLDERIHSKEKIQEGIQAADVVGLSAMTPYLHCALEWGKYARSQNKVTMMGGPHATVDPHSLLDSGLFDFVFIREAEITIREALPLLHDKEKLKDVPGLGFFADNGEKVVTPERPFTTDLDEVPMPARQLLPMEEYFNRNQDRLVYVTTSRGCPYTCVFCQKKVYGKKFRARSVANIMEELTQLKKDYQPGSILFIDELFTCKPDRVFELCKALRESNLDLEWCAETRVDRIDLKMMEVMRDSGLKRMYFGVESGAPQSLLTLKKRFTIDTVIKTLKNTRKANIWTKIFLIIGTPGETMEDFEQTAAMLRKAHPDRVRSALFNPLIGSPSFEIYHDRIDFDLIFSEFVASKGTPYKHENFSVEELNEIDERIIREYEEWYAKPAQRFYRWYWRMRYYLLHPRVGIPKLINKVLGRSKGPS